MSENITYNYEYRKDYLENSVIWIKDLLSQFVQMTTKYDDLKISLDLLIESIVEADKEACIYRQLHGLSKITRALDIALICNCILKLKPIHSQSTYINEIFCVYLLISSFADKNIDEIDSEYAQFLIYMLRHGDISKDALYLLTKTLSTYLPRREEL